LDEDFELDGEGAVDGGEGEADEGEGQEGDAVLYEHGWLTKGGRGRGGEGRKQFARASRQNQQRQSGQEEASTCVCMQWVGGVNIICEHIQGEEPYVSPTRAHVAATKSQCFFSKASQRVIFHSKVQQYTCLYSTHPRPFECFRSGLIGLLFAFPHRVVRLHLRGNDKDEFRGLLPM